MLNRFRKRLPCALGTAAMFLVTGGYAHATVAANAAKSLSVRGEIDHLFSQASNGHGGTRGFDGNGDGRISVSDESVRDAPDLHAYDATRLLKKLDGVAGQRDRFVTRAEAKAFFRKFDRNHDGRLGGKNGEFRRAQAAVWGSDGAPPHGVPTRPSPLGFEIKVF